MRNEARETLVGCDTPIRTALQQLCDTGKGVLFIVEDGVLKGSLSDGDIRRHLLSGGDIDSTATTAANKRPKFLFSAERERATAFMFENHISAVPVLDEDLRVVDVVFARESLPLDDVTIRELETGDFGMVMEFFDQMAGDTRAMFNRNDANRMRVTEHLHRKRDDGEIHFAATVRAVDGTEKMVGYVFLWDIDTNVPWLGLAVREEWKGHQLGRRLLEFVDSWAKPRGYGGIMLTSVPANIRAHSLYARMGYAYCGVYPDSEFLFLKRYLRGGAAE